VHEIFAYFLPRPNDTKEEMNKRLGYASWFCDSIPLSEFTKEEAVMWYMISYSTVMGVPLKEKYLITFLDSEVRSFIVTNNIRVSGTEQFDFESKAAIDTAVRITKNLIMDEYRELMETDAKVDEFIACADAFMNTRLDDSILSLYKTGYDILSGRVGDKVGSRDALDYTLSQADQLAEIYDKEKLEELGYKVDGESLNEEDQFKFVTDTGITELDADMEGAYTTQVIGVEAPPGTGKTRFATGVFAYRAAVIHHQGVLYYTLEQTEWEIKCILIARHILETTGLQISDKLIRFNKVPKDLKKTVEAAKIDLFESGKYKIDIIETTLYVDDFIRDMKRKDSLNGPYMMIILDYISLLEQRQGKFKKALLDYQVVSRGYTLFKRYIRKSRKCGIAVNQLNQTGVENAEQDKDATTRGAQGGMAAYRATDYNIVISVTEPLRAQKKRRLSNPKQRGSEGFSSVIVNTRLGCGYWYSDENKKIV
jgi:replicative DNA helicase